MTWIVPRSLFRVYPQWIRLTMAATNQTVWIVRYGLTKYPLQENIGPYDSESGSYTRSFANMGSAHSLGIERVACLGQVLSSNGSIQCIGAPTSKSPLMNGNQQLSSLTIILFRSH